MQTHRGQSTYLIRHSHNLTQHAANMLHCAGTTTSALLYCLGQHEAWQLNLSYQTERSESISGSVISTEFDQILKSELITNCYLSRTASDLDDGKFTKTVLYAQCELAGKDLW